MTVGFSRLLLSFERLPGLGLVYEEPGRKGYYSVNPEAYDFWMNLQGAIGLVAAVLFAILRRGRPAWMAGLLLVVAWHGAFEIGFWSFAQRGSTPG